MLAHAFTLTLPFQLDDYQILARVGSIFRSGTLDASGAYFFRPTAWVFWAALTELGGGLAVAPLFHGALLLLHGLAAWLLYRLLRSCVGGLSACAGAVLFALMPGGIQAVSWVSASGDLIAVVLLLAAIVAARRFLETGAAWALPAIGGLACASFLAKETMVALVPAAVIGMWRRDGAESVAGAVRRGTGPFRSPAAPALVAAFGIACGAMLRWRMIGTFGPAYAFEPRFEAEDLLRIHVLLLQAIVPWNQAPEFAGIVPWAGSMLGSAFGADPLRVERIAVLGAAGIPVALGFLVAPRRTARAAIALGAALFVACAPIAVVWNFDGLATNHLARAFYGPLAILASLAAWCAAPLMRWRSTRIAALALLSVVAILELDLGVHVARTELAAAEAIRARLDSLEAAARSEASGTHFVAIDAQAGLGGVPLLGLGVEHALRPPFSRSGVPVTWWREPETLERCAALRDEIGPVRIVIVRDARFVPLGELVPSQPSALPPLAPAVGEPGRLAFADPVPARAVAGLRFRGRLEEGRTGPPQCHFEGGGAAVTGAVGAAGEGVWLAVAPEPASLNDLAYGHLRSVRIDGIVVEGAPEVLRRLPRIDLAVPIARHLLVLGALPEIDFEAPFDSGSYAITFGFVLGSERLPIVYTVPRDRLQKLGARRYRFVPSKNDRVTWPGHRFLVTWHDLPEAVAREFGSRWHGAPVDFRVEGLVRDGACPEARSEWDTLQLLDRH